MIIVQVEITESFESGNVCVWQSPNIESSSIRGNGVRHCRSRKFNRIVFTSSLHPFSCVCHSFGIVISNDKWHLLFMQTAKHHDSFSHFQMFSSLLLWITRSYHFNIPKQCKIWFARKMFSQMCDARVCLIASHTIAIAAATYVRWPKFIIFLWIIAECAWSKCRCKSQQKKNKNKMWIKRKIVYFVLFAFEVALRSTDVQGSGGKMENY